MMALTTLRPFLLVSTTTGKSCAVAPPYTVPPAPAVIARELPCCGLAAAASGETASTPVATAHAHPSRRRMSAGPDLRMVILLLVYVDDVSTIAVAGTLSLAGARG